VNDAAPPRARHGATPRWLEVAAGAIAALAILVGAASWFQPDVDGADLWWHLASGRTVAERCEVPQTDPFSHTARGRPWTNHSWLWGTIFWLAYAGHPDRAAWLNLVLLAALFSLVAWNAWRASRSWLAAGAATWLAAAASHAFLDVRPHVATLLFTALLLATLDRPRAPWLWPPLFALWANLHGGFVFGLGLLGLHAGLRSVETTERGLAFPRSAWAGLLGAALATGLNPWGFAIYAVPFQPVDPDTPFHTVIEWRALTPSLDPRTTAGRFGWVALLSLAGAARARAPFPIALALVAGAMALLWRRFVPLFAVVAAPLVAVALGTGLGLVRRALPAAPPAGAWLRAAAGGAALVVALSLWRDVRLLPHPLQRWTARESFPTGAAAYLAGMPHPPRRLFHFYDWGGFLMLEAPGVPVFVDGRAVTVYDAAVARAYLALIGVRPGWREQLDALRIDAVLVLPGSPLASALRSERPPWRVAHIDPRSVLLFRPDDPERRSLPAASELLAGSDLALSRAFRWRRRGDLGRASEELLAARRLDPLNLPVYGELMQVAALQDDAPGVERWIDEALRVYPSRSNQIWAFAESAFGAMGRCEAQLDALRRIRLDAPFAPDALRAEAAARIRRVEAALAAGSAAECREAADGTP
jgi:hypothetical protein